MVFKTRYAGGVALGVVRLRRATDFSDMAVDIVTRPVEGAMGAVEEGATDASTASKASCGRMLLDAAQPKRVYEVKEKQPKSTQDQRR